jgi:stalled ribosome rescue protein Dom34
VGFATPDKLWYAEHVPLPMPDGVYWEDGIRVAPYVRGLKQARPVVVLVLDSRRARIFRYRSGEVVELQDCRADTFMGDITDVGMSKRPASHTGVRGETSTDTAQRVLDYTFERMLKYALEQVGAVMDPHSFLVVGGTNESAARAFEELPKHLQARAVQSPPLYLEIGTTELREIVEQAASQLTKRSQLELLDQVVEQAGAGGRACLGREETLKALEEMRVDTLLLSRRLIRAEPELADRCVGQALAQDAAVEELGDAGGERLDQSGGGIGARLRYQIKERAPRRERQTTAGESA